MPSLGADMDAGTLLEWLVVPGQQVHRGELVAVVETDKGAIEIEIFQDGVIESLLVDVGAKVPVGTPLATLGGADPTVEPRKQAPAEPRPGHAPAPPTPEVPRAATAPTRAPTTTRASPYARRLAAERGIDLATVSGSGPDGAVIARDLQGEATAPRPPVDPMRAAIALAMERSKREIPHYYLAMDIDLSATLSWLEHHNAAVTPPERLLVAAPLLKAAALAARAVPEVNGRWVDGSFHLADAVHLGVAISLRGGGLVSPALHDADKLTLAELMKRLSDLVARARRGRLRRAELVEGTLTVSSLGDRGADEVIGVIHPPQVSLVGYGRVGPRPWVEGDGVVVRPVVRATLAGDHRAHDGHRGSLYLRAISELLQQPEEL